MQTSKKTRFFQYFKCPIYLYSQKVVKYFWNIHEVKLLNHYYCQKNWSHAWKKITTSLQDPRVLGRFVQNLKRELKTRVIFRQRRAADRGRFIHGSVHKCVMPSSRPSRGDVMNKEKRNVGERRQPRARVSRRRVGGLERRERSA